MHLKPMDLARLLKDAITRLTPVSSSPRLDAQLLIQAALGVNRAWLIAHDRDTLSADEVERISTFIDRRASGEPVAYILGEREFFGRPFKVTPATLIPRPDTETLIEAALDHMPRDRPTRVLDIGTGTGCIAITLKLERPEWTLTAVDFSSAALAVARENGQSLDAEVTWLESDLFTALNGQRFDLIVSNPPYIAVADPHLTQGDLRFEPTSALASGAEGLNALRAIAKSAPAYLKPGAWLMLEHGYDQAEAVADLLRDAGLKEAFLSRDLAGQARVSGGRLDENGSGASMHVQV
jgi:release factor glutamine methyltransferase